MLATTWRIRLVGGAILVALTVVSVMAYRLAQTLPESPLFTTLGYLGVFLLTTTCSATLFLPLPAFGAIGVAGGLLNPLLVGLVAGAGAATGEMTGYLAGRGGGLVLGNRALGSIERIRNLVDRHGFLTLLVLSAVPNPLFDVAGLAAGSLGYSPRRYWVAVALGKSIVYCAIATLGEAVLPALD